MKNLEIVKIKMEMIRELPGKIISSPKDTYELIKEYLEYADREYCLVISLNTKNRVHNISIVSIGSINSSIVHPREVFKTAILSNASSIIIAHNHPSGDPTPSKEDIAITERIEEVGNILGIELLDHLVVGDNKYLSLREKNLL